MRTLNEMEVSSVAGGITIQEFKERYLEILTNENDLKGKYISIPS